MAAIDPLAILTREIGITDVHLDSKISEKLIRTIAKHFSGWERYVGLPGLGLNEGQKEDVKHQFFLHGNEMGMIKALTFWHKEHPQATCRSLVGILLDLNEGQLTSTLCREVVELASCCDPKDPEYTTSPTTPGCLKTGDLIGKFENRFIVLRKAALQEVSNQGIPVEDFRQTLMTLPRAITSEHEKFLLKKYPLFEEAKSIESIFLHLNFYLSFIDFSLLEHIIEHYYSNGLKEQMRHYAQDMKQFRIETTISKVLPHLPQRSDSPKEYTSLEIKVDFNINKTTLEDLDTYRKQFACEFLLSQFVLSVSKVKKSSLIVMLLFPSSLTTYLKEKIAGKLEDKEFVQQYSILEVTVDGESLLYATKAAVTSLASGSEKALASVTGKYSQDASSVSMEIADDIASAINTSSKSRGILITLFLSDKSDDSFHFHYKYYAPKYDDSFRFHYKYYAPESEDSFRFHYKYYAPESEDSFRLQYRHCVRGFTNLGFAIYNYEGFSTSKSFDDTILAASQLVQYPLSPDYLIVVAVFRDARHTCSKTQNMIKSFLPPSAPHLADKPKIFLISSCEPFPTEISVPLEGNFLVAISTFHSLFIGDDFTSDLVHSRDSVEDVLRHRYTHIQSHLYKPIHLMPLEPADIANLEPTKLEPLTRKRIVYELTSLVESDSRGLAVIVGVGLSKLDQQVKEVAKENFTELTKIFSHLKFAIFRCSSTSIVELETILTKVVSFEQYPPNYPIVVVLISSEFEEASVPVSAIRNEPLVTNNPKIFIVNTLTPDPIKEFLLEIKNSMISCSNPTSEYIVPVTKILGHELITNRGSIQEIMETVNDSLPPETSSSLTSCLDTPVYLHPEGAIVKPTPTISQPSLKAAVIAESVDKESVITVTSRSATAERISKLKAKLRALRHSTLEELRKRNVSFFHFKLDFLAPPTAVRKDNKQFLKRMYSLMEEANTFGKLFIYLNAHLTFLDFSLLECIVEKYCSSDLQKNMSEYSTEVRQFRLDTTLDNALPYLPKRFASVESKLELETDLNTCSMSIDDLEQYRKKCDYELPLSEFLVLVSIQTGLGNS